jgi:hypothetical protein
MRSRLFATTLLALLAFTVQVRAHEGHEHKFMGKVVVIDDKTIAVEGLDGKKVTGMLGAETKYLRDKAAVARTDVKVGERVVIVIVEGEKKAQNVKQVLLGTAAAEEHKEAPHKH